MKLTKNSSPAPAVPCAILILMAILPQVFSADVTLVPRESNQWRYYTGDGTAGNQAPPDVSSKNWKDKDYVPGTGWTAAQLPSPQTSPIGWASAGESGAIKSTIATGIRGRKAYYFRHQFTLAAVDQCISLELQFDDGVIAHLNGVEVARINMPAGAVTQTTAASSGRSAPDETYYEPKVFLASSVIPTLTLNPSPGTNVLAIEVHQRADSDSDFRMDAQLRLGNICRGPYLQPGAQPNEVRIKWRSGTANRACVVAYGQQFPSNWQSLAQSVDHTVTIPVGSNSAGRAVIPYGILAETSIPPATAPALGLGTDNLPTGVLAIRQHPQKGTSDSMRLWVLGDPGNYFDNRGSMTLRNAERVRDQYLSWANGVAPDLMLMNGDISYTFSTFTEGTDAAFQRAIFDMYEEVLPFSILLPAVGNHEDISTATSDGGPTPDANVINANQCNLPVKSGSVTVWEDVFDMPTTTNSVPVPSAAKERYYSYDYGNVHIVCLDSQTQFTVPVVTNGVTNDAVFMKMMTWLDKDLSQNLQPWVIAFWHHPPHVSGGKNSNTAYRSIVMREQACAILEKWGVDLVIAGHIHNYHRSQLLGGFAGPNTASGNFNSTNHVVQFGDGNPAGGQAYVKKTEPYRNGVGTGGTVYVNVGNSSNDDDANVLHPAMLRGFGGTNEVGSLVLDISGNRLDATYIRSAATTENPAAFIAGGTLSGQADSFTILKKFNVSDLESPLVSHQGLGIKNVRGGEAVGWKTSSASQRGAGWRFPAPSLPAINPSETSPMVNAPAVRPTHVASNSTFVFSGSDSKFTRATELGDYIGAEQAITLVCDSTGNNILHPQNWAGGLLTAANDDGIFAGIGYDFIYSKDRWDCKGLIYHTSWSWAESVGPFPHITRISDMNDNVMCGGMADAYWGDPCYVAMRVPAWDYQNASAYLLGFYGYGRASYGNAINCYGTVAGCASIQGPAPTFPSLHRAFRITTDIPQLGGYEAQTSLGVMPIAAGAITLYAQSGGVTNVTSAGHGLSTGAQITISGSGTASYNGTFTITVVSSSVFSIPVSFVSNPSAKGGWQTVTLFTHSCANDINEAGTVVGFCTNAVLPETNPVVNTEPALTPTNCFPGGYPDMTSSGARAFVAWPSTENGVRQYRMEDLNKYVSLPTGTFLTAAVAVNDFGEILCRKQNGSNVSYCVLQP